MPSATAEQFAGIETQAGSAEQAHDAAGGEQKKGGFPQLDATTYPSQLFWLTIVFCLMFFLMSKVALPKVGSVIDARRPHNENNLAAAAKAQSQGDAIKLQNDLSRSKASEQAQAALIKAAQNATEKANDEMARFGDQARQRVTAAETAIAKARADAMASVADIAAEAACDIAQRIAGVSMQKADARKIVANIVQKESA